MQNNERREHILEKIFQECVFYSWNIDLKPGIGVYCKC